LAGSALSLTSFAAAGAGTGRTTLSGSIPAWANSKNYAGPASAKGDVGFRVYLGWNDPSGCSPWPGPCPIRTAHRMAII